MFFTDRTVELTEEKMLGSKMGEKVVEDASKRHQVCIVKNEDEEEKRRKGRRKCYAPKMLMVNEMLLLLMETSNTATTQLIYRSLRRRFVVADR